VSNAIANFQPKLVWAGPLSTVAHDVADVTSLPLVALSWGYDLLRDAAVDPEIAASIASTIERASRVHVDCDAGRRAAVQLGAQSENIIQFPWGIDLVAFPMRNPQASADQLTVVSARSMEAVYDVATTIEAFSLVARERTDLDARLVLVGSGSLEPDLRRLAVDRGVASQIDWLGRLAEADLQRVLAASTVYVSSSTVDGTSITLLQAMATGLPCIVSDVGGNSEWIRHGETGLTFESGDFEALAKCLEETLDSGSSRAAFGAAAREEVERRGDWKSHQDRLIAVCNALVGIP
jgi:glycosyltransferase involved in cell wall biosynthesis